MIALGLVLIVLVVVLGIAIAVSNPEVVTLNVFNALVPVTMGGVFFTGAGALLALLVGALLVHNGLARSRRLRRQYRALDASEPSAAPTASTETASPKTTATDTRATDTDTDTRQPVESAPTLTSPTPIVTAPSAPVTTWAPLTTAAPEPNPDVRADSEIRAEPEVRAETTTPRTTPDSSRPSGATAVDRSALLAEADPLTRDVPDR